MSGLLVRLLVGWRLFRAQGERLEELLTEGTRHGYRLWRVERRGTAIWGFCTEDGFDVLLLVAQGLDIEIVSVRQGGLPFRWKQIKLRPFLLAGLATALMLVFYATTHIWAVQVVAAGLTPKASTQLAQVAKESGLAIGAGRNAIRIPEVRRKILAQLPEYAWIGIHMRGMVAVIDGVRFAKRPPNHLPPKLIAAKAGKVTALYVFMGDAQVAVGNEVHPGQVLIAGEVSDVSVNQPQDAKIPQERRVVTPAEGEVQADVTYQVKFFQPSSVEREVLTGRQSIQRFLRIEGGAVFKIPAWPQVSFSHYHVKKLVNALHFAGVALPVQRVELVYNEIVARKERLGRRPLVSLAREEALKRMRKIAPKNSKPVRNGEQIAFSKTGVWVTLTWVVNENIAVSPESNTHSP